MADCPSIYTVVLLLLPPKKFAIRPKFGLSSDAPLFSIGFVDWLVCYCKAVIQLARCLMKCRTCGTGEGKGALGPGFSGSFFSALVILLSSCCFLFKMTKFSLQQCHFSLKTLSFDDFVMATWEREVQSQRKKEPKYLGLFNLNLILPRHVHECYME